MVRVKLDIDIESPYLLARELFTIANHECQIRLSATKGVHLIIEGLTSSQAFSIRSRLDDPHRLHLDEERLRGNPHATINVLWDKKDGKESGVWLHWRTRSLAFWLLQDTGRTMRSCIINLHQVMVLHEFKEAVIAIADLSPF